MKPLLFDLGSAEGLADRLRARLPIEEGEIERRRFPDGESYVRLGSVVRGRDVALLCPLNSPDEKTLPLLFAAAAARAHGARRVGLVAPYLAYMRQDHAFRPGEAVSSSAFASILSAAFDWLITVDPHLHRHSNLGSIYTIPAAAVSAARPIAEWIAKEVISPFLIGPDEESAQWVRPIADLAKAPFATLRKSRRGDREVRISTDDLAIGDRIPVIIDDIISSGGTMAEAVRLIRQTGARTPVCIGVHALFAGDALAKLQAAGSGRIVTVDTIGHPTNAIGIAEELSGALARLLRHSSR